MAKDGWHFWRKKTRWRSGCAVSFKSRLISVGNTKNKRASYCIFAQWALSLREPTVIRAFRNIALYISLKP